MSEPLCHCGQPLHYANPQAREIVERMIEAHGETVRITVGHRTWLVPRHYLALHGLQAATIEQLGFKEVTPKPYVERYPRGWHPDDEKPG